MKALKSELVKKLQQAGIRIPLREGSKIVFEDIVYTINYVPKASY